MIFDYNKVKDVGKNADLYGARDHQPDGCVIGRAVRALCDEKRRKEIQDLSIGLHKLKVFALLEVPYVHAKENISPSWGITWDQVEETSRHSPKQFDQAEADFQARLEEAGHTVIREGQTLEKVQQKELVTV
jgi:hypothetical protein